VRLYLRGRDRKIARGRLAHSRANPHLTYLFHRVSHRRFYGLCTEDRTASSMVSTASFLLKPLPRSSERQV
jgi:hypothetical protein